MQAVMLTHSVPWDIQSTHCCDPKERNASSRAGHQVYFLLAPG